MPKRDTSGRNNQRLRTRKDLLLAAARLLKKRRKPNMEDVAAEALVSRATAYRYFPNLELLLAEAPLDGAVPDPKVLFADDRSQDPEDRVDRVEAAMHEMIYRNEARLRLMLVGSLNRRDDVGRESGPPRRQNRRTPLIEAALAPARDRFDPDVYERLCLSLAMILGPESMVVFRDVIPISRRRARAVKSWTVRALVRAAIAQSESNR